MTNTITLLGATGSIGTQVLDVIRRMPERFHIEALAAGCNVSRLAEQVGEFRPKIISIQNVDDRPALLELLNVHAPDFRGEILVGAEGLDALAELSGVDTVIVGLVGLIGLQPSLKALKAGKRLLTANKETFVTGGHLIQPYLDRVIPIDSEHVAIHQCLIASLSAGSAQGEPSDAGSASVIDKIYLTASGGPFRTWDKARLERATVEEALKHPNWVMGRKITIDSATMMNKGLEIIEAHWLFDVPYERIQVVVHPESVMHSGVAFVDGSVMMQLGAPDMHGPIQYAMTYPERLSNPEPGVRLDLFALSRLNLEPPDMERFPCIRLAYEAGRLGSSATAVLNGADEMAVERFLNREIGFMDIPRCLDATLKAHEKAGITAHPSLDEIHALDAWARAQVCRNLTDKPLISA
jgi:1-deoxy-D-xylulose-5-phosphate reductoisomerase